MSLRVGDRVWVPRSSGKCSPGTIEHIWGEVAQVKLDQLGRRGQPLGKNVYLEELARLVPGEDPRVVGA